jgi:hypothetical protein
MASLALRRLDTTYHTTVAQQVHIQTSRRPSRNHNATNTPPPQTQPPPRIRRCVTPTPSWGTLAAGCRAPQHTGHRHCCRQTRATAACSAKAPLTVNTVATRKCHVPSTSPPRAGSARSRPPTLQSRHCQELGLRRRAAPGHTEAPQGARPAAQDADPVRPRVDSARAQADPDAGATDATAMSTSKESTKGRRREEEKGGGAPPLPSLRPLGPPAAAPVAARWGPTLVGWRHWGCGFRPCRSRGATSFFIDWSCLEK